MRELYRQLKWDIEELEDLINEIQYLGEMDEIDIDELEVEIEESIALLNGHLEDIFKQVRKNYK